VDVKREEVQGSGGELMFDDEGGMDGVEKAPVTEP